MIAITTRKIVALATCSSLLLGVPLGTAGAFQDQSSAPNSQSATPQNQSQDQGAQGDGSPQSSDDGSQPADNSSNAPVSAPLSADQLDRLDKITPAVGDHHNEEQMRMIER